MTSSRLQRRSRPVHRELAGQSGVSSIGGLADPQRHQAQHRVEDLCGLVGIDLALHSRHVPAVNTGEQRHPGFAGRSIADAEFLRCHRDENALRKLRERRVIEALAQQDARERAQHTLHSALHTGLGGWIKLRRAIHIWHINAK